MFWRRKQKPQQQLSPEIVKLEQNLARLNDIYYKNFHEKPFHRLMTLTEYNLELMNLQLVYFERLQAQFEGEIDATDN